MLGVALNEVFVPILQKQFPEITDFYLPPEGCSYRMAIVSMRKSYPGHAKRLMFGVWSFLRQFMYTKFIVVTDDDVDIRDWKDVIWRSRRAWTRCATRRWSGRRRSTTSISPPRSAGSGKMGLDATHSGPPKPRASGAGRSSWSRPSNSASRHSSNSCCRRSRTPQTSAGIPL